MLLEQITIVPLAAESLGVRSMCTFVETSDVKILLDAGVSLAPNRNGFPPHPKEYEAIRRCREKISRAADEAEVVTLSHYHFDHHTPSYQDWCYNWSSRDVAKRIYKGKTVFVKNFRSMINFSQRRRGWLFKKTGGKHAERLEIADGKTFEFGDTRLKFSEPVFHGSENSELGWLLMLTIEHSREKVLFASDVQGPMCNPTLGTILAERPQLVIMGGPPIYLSGFRVREEHVRQGMQNLESLAKNVPTTILEHHILREEKWREFSQPIFDAASKTGHSVVTAAEFLGEENNLLEFRRDHLFKVEPPSSEFERWMKLPRPERKLVRPPI
ncbi:MAG: hypothetical protein JSV29_01285 [Candidatus Bathyarchaeota archaeon]|nr:MAG: hypothetical protein JSV29_01285 [Candidatus Bathyarchaeota archaeon]